MVSKKVVFQTEWFSIEKQNKNKKDSQNKPYYTLSTPDGVIIFALTPENKIVLVKQYRPAIGGYTLEFPSGQLDKKESPGKAVLRELYEETGYQCRIQKYFGFGRVMSNRSSMRLHAFFGMHAQRDPSFRPKEEIEVFLVTYKELKEMVLKGEFQQWFALSLLLMVQWENPQLFKKMENVLC